MDHPVKALIEAADRAISERDFDRLMDFYADNATLVVKPGLHVNGRENIRRAFVAISEHFEDSLHVRQGRMVVVGGGDNALVLMETLLDIPGEPGSVQTIVRKATYVFARSDKGVWLCTVDNSFGTDLIE